MEATISLKEKKYIEKLIKNYEDREISKLEELRILDRKVKRRPETFAYIFGTIGSLVLELGMSIAMKVILSDLMFIGIIIGLVGILMVSVNYLIYKHLLIKGKKKYQHRIIELSNELLNINN